MGAGGPHRRSHLRLGPWRQRGGRCGPGPRAGTGRGWPTNSFFFSHVWWAGDWWGGGAPQEGKHFARRGDVCRLALSRVPPPRVGTVPDFRSDGRHQGRPWAVQAVRPPAHKSKKHIVIYY
jgi:hypothetical protein